MLQPIISTNLSGIKILLAKHRVTQAFAFGSVCSSNFNEDSDVDILIQLDASLEPLTYGEHYFQLADELEKLLDRKVDLVTVQSLKNPYFISSIEKTKVLLA